MKGAEKWKPTLHGPKGISNEYHHWSVCVPVLQLQIVLSLSRSCVMSLRLYVNPQALLPHLCRLTQYSFMCIPSFQYFSTEVKWKIQVSVFAPWIKMWSSIPLYKIQWSSSFHGLFHARSFTSTTQCHGIEINGTTLNYMDEYLFIIHTTNIYASCNFSFFF